ncbi:MAG: DUF1631 family protein [Pseudomonadota bacterium]|nr:DUF1631 family protein [Pseudomonadota bacterium]MDP1902889.1 DUF1631 family protein [Pseudomonadota bacterium]MDP2352407.1 DUF1631 family protein [Pseudomonadota bacterium]
MLTMPPKPPSTREVFVRIQDEMASQLTKSGAPEEVHDFLMRDWVRLLASIFVAKGNQHGDWKAGWETAHALLWSLAPKQGREETGTLIRMLPSLLSRLHAGCAALGMELSERDALFERLAMLHAAVAREGLQAEPDEEGPITRLRAEDVTEAEDSDLRNLTAPDLPATDRRYASPELKLGDQVVFQGEGRERRLILTWISPMGGMYMFANAQGRDALTLTHARLLAKFQAGDASRLPAP